MSGYYSVPQYNYTLPPHCMQPPLPAQSSLSHQPLQPSIPYQPHQPQLSGGIQSQYVQDVNESRMPGYRNRKTNVLKPNNGAKRLRRKQYNPHAEMKRLQNQMVKVQQQCLQQQWLDECFRYPFAYAPTINPSAITLPVAIPSQVASSAVVTGAENTESANCDEPKATSKVKMEEGALKNERKRWWWPFH